MAASIVCQRLDYRKETSMGMHRVALGVVGLLLAVCGAVRAAGADA